MTPLPLRIKGPSVPGLNDKRLKRRTVISADHLKIVLGALWNAPRDLNHHDAADRARAWRRASSSIHTVALMVMDDSELCTWLYWLSEAAAELAVAAGTSEQGRAAA